MLSISMRIDLAIPVRLNRCLDYLQLHLQARRSPLDRSRSREIDVSMPVQVFNSSSQESVFPNNTLLVCHSTVRACKPLPRRVGLWTFRLNLTGRECLQDTD